MVIDDLSMSTPEAPAHPGVTKRMPTAGTSTGDAVLEISGAKSGFNDSNGARVSARPRTLSADGLLVHKSPTAELATAAVIGGTGSSSAGWESRRLTAAAPDRRIPNLGNGPAETGLTKFGRGAGHRLPEPGSEFPEARVSAPTARAALEAALRSGLGRSGGPTAFQEQRYKEAAENERKKKEKQQAGLQGRTRARTEKKAAGAAVSTAQTGQGGHGSASGAAHLAEGVDFP